MTDISSMLTFFRVEFDQECGLELLFAIINSQGLPYFREKKAVTNSNCHAYAHRYKCDCSILIVWRTVFCLQ